jgi:hypothetical protein
VLIPTTSYCSFGSNLEGYNGGLLLVLLSTDRRGRLVEDIQMSRLCGTRRLAKTTSSERRVLART